jgi:hypothetical protein
MLAVGLLGGCYASHTAVDSVDAGRGDDAARPDTPPPPDDAGRDVATPDVGTAPCTWVVSPEVQLEGVPAPETLTDVQWTGDGYLVGLQGGGARGAQFAQRVRFEMGPVVEGPHRVFGPPSMSYGSMRLALSGDGVAASRWDSLAGCQFRRLSSDGSPLALGRAIEGARYCNGFTGMREGFYLMDNPDADAGVRFHRLDADGGSHLEIPRLEIFGEDYEGHTRVAFADDSQLLVALDQEPPALATASCQPIDARGRSTGAPIRLPWITRFTVMQSIATTTGALIGWTEDEAEAGDAPALVLRLAPVTREGAPVADPAVVADRVSAVVAWSITHVRGETFVVYIELADAVTGETAIRAQRADDLGRPVGEPILVAIPTHGQQVLAQTNGDEVFVVYTRGLAPERETFALRLECVAER